MFARTSFRAVIAGIGLAILALLISLAVATGGAPSAAPPAERAATVSNTQSTGVHPNTANREQRELSPLRGDAITADGHSASQPDGARTLQLSNDWSAYRSAERAADRWTRQ